MQCRQAAQLFLGRHDFTQFANAGAVGVDPHKTLTRFDVVECGRDQLCFEVEGSGFLHRMVRHMVRSLSGVLNHGDLLHGRCWKPVACSHCDGLDLPWTRGLKVVGGSRWELS